MDQKCPDFLVIGAQRAGTSWIHKVLNSHPEVWMPPLKEIHYFDYMDRYHCHYKERRRYSKDLKTALIHIVRNPLNWEKLKWFTIYFCGKRNNNWYSSLFKVKNSLGKITGEVTPAYKNLSIDMWNNIYLFRPNIKLILILRDPVKRIWSNLVRKESRQKNIAIDNVSVNQLVSALQKKELYFINSTYSDTINKIEWVFSEKNILYMFFDEITDESIHFHKKLCNFLNISNEYTDTMKIKPVNVAARNSDAPDPIKKIVLEKMEEEYRWMAKRFPYGPPMKWARKYELI